MSILVFVGAAQGFFLALYWFAKSGNRSVNKWLAMLLTVVSLHLVEYGLDISGISLKYPFIIASTYPLLFLMGPLFFIYCHALLDTQFRFKIKFALHFLPVIIFMLLMLPFYTMPGNMKVNFISGLDQGGAIQIPIEQFVFMGAHVVQTIIYVYLSSRLIKDKERLLKNVSSDTHVMKRLGFMKSFTLAFSTYLALYFIVVVALTMIDSFHVEVDYVLLLLMAVSVYAIGYTAIDKPEVFNAVVVTKRELVKIPGLKRRLEEVMVTHKPYQKNDLRITDLSDQLGVSSHQLSQVINDELEMNFYDFVNKYRVEDAKKLLVDGDKDLKVLAIAFEVGFNSKATFNRVFKKLTDLTPSEFQERFSGDKSQ